MKYDKEYVSKMVFKDYIELIVKELNENGFVNAANAPYKLGTDIYGGWLWRSYSCFMTTVSDAKAVDYLKSIGLLNNGRCPLTGLMLSNQDYTYESKLNSSINFQVNKEWIKLTGNNYNIGCIGALVLLVVLLILMIVYGLTSHLFIAVGCTIAYLVFNVLSHMSTMGKELNYQSIAKQVGTTPISIKTCFKFREEMDRMYQTHSSKRVLELPSIASGDFEAFQDWLNSGQL